MEIACDQSPASFGLSSLSGISSYSGARVVWSALRTHWAELTPLQDGAQSLGSEDLVLFSSTQVYLVWGQVGQAKLRSGARWLDTACCPHCEITLLLSV